MAPPQHPRQAMRVFAQNWLARVSAWKNGRELDNTRAGSPADSHDELGPLLEARANLLMECADDDGIWEATESRDTNEIVAMTKREGDAEGDLVVRLERSRETYGAGREAMERGDYLFAINRFNESNAAFPHFKTLELLGECHLHVGQPLDAMIPLAAAIGLGTNAYRATYLLGRAIAEAGWPRQAIQYLDRAIEMKPDFKRAREFRDALARRTSDH